MIDPDIPSTIRFSPDDQPELSEIDQAIIKAEHEERERQKEETQRWLEEHLDWTPLGDVW